MSLLVVFLSTIPVIAQELVKEKDIVIYQDERFYSAFPSIIMRPDGELITAFRRAPERRYLGEASTDHTDPNSYLVLVRSQDNGETWSTEPELIFAHPFGGSQDPCLIQLKNNNLLCSSYGWARIQPEVAEKIDTIVHDGGFVFMGGYLLQSEDGGKHWSGPIIPPPVPGKTEQNLFKEPCPAYNRGPMWEGRDGLLYWAVACRADSESGRTEVHLMVSPDGGSTWDYRCPIATDPEITFNETALIETQKGTLIAFLRTAYLDDHTVVARSEDGGKSFLPWEDTGFKGHPHCATCLPDGRILLVYGYRHKPYGIRARILDPEATNFADSTEIVLREDGGNSDLGYPWVTAMADGRYLVVYYFNQDNGIRHIAGSILSLNSE